MDRGRPVLPGQTTPSITVSDAVPQPETADGDAYHASRNTLLCVTIRCKSRIFKEGFDGKHDERAIMFAGRIDRKENGRMKTGHAAYRVIIMLIAPLLLVGCTTITRITSNPAGATVSLDGRYIGETPTSCVVHNKVGWHSTYTFTATKAGYRADTKICQERHGWSDDVIPPLIHFDLQQLESTEKK